MLCVKRRFDQKNRILIPVEFIREAGGDVDCEVYVQHEEGTNEIRLVFPRREGNGNTDIQTENIH